MINSDKVIKIANGNNGYVTTKMIKESGIPTIELTRLIKQNKLERISRGYYVLKGSFNDEYYRCQLKSKNAIFSHATALYFYDLSDRTPLYFDITVPNGYNGSLSKDKNVVLHYVKKEYLKRYPDRINVSLADIQNDKEFMAKLQSIDGLIDDEIARKGKEINEKERPNDVYIIDSRLAWSNVPDSYAIRLTVNEAIAGKRVFYDTTRGSEDQYETVDEAIQKTRKRKLGEIERYKEKYGINLLDENNYDLVVDTSYTNTQELADIIVSGEEAYRTGKSYPKYWANPTCAER